MQILTQERLHELLRYDPDTGAFTWRVRVGARVKVGDIAGSITDSGYLQICYDQKLYRAHRLVWLYVHGHWPINQIDHIDGDPANNRLKNLREATTIENGQNQRRAHRSNKTSGLLGVCWDKWCKKWRASICVAGKRHYLGIFPSAVDAHEAYLAAKRNLHPFGML